jgi:hypothetical protein
MIVDYLRKNKHTVIFEQIKNETEESIRNMDRKTRMEFLSKVEGWVKSCDFVIAETSYPSVSVGFEVALALRYAKPVLVLYSAGDPPSLLLHHSYDRLHTEKYTPSSVGRIIDDFILYIEGKHDTRFTFFLPEELNAYLEDASRRKKLTKSMYLRRLIEKDFTENDR